MPTIRLKTSEANHLVALALSRGGAVQGQSEVPASKPAHRTGEMNKTEAAYAQVLEARKQTGEVSAYLFERVKLRLAKGCWYTPDFVVFRADGGIEVHEVKGFWRDDARVKWKAAAEQNQWARFVAVTKRGKGWAEEWY